MMNVPTDLPSEKGTYTLLLHLNQKTVLTVGRLGSIALGGGWCVCSGSALEPGGLRARLARHLTARVRPHWHIDYLKTVAACMEIHWVVSDYRIECRLAATVRGLPGAEPIMRFGSSDCTCESHLFHFRTRPHRPYDAPPGNPAGWTFSGIKKLTPRNGTIS